MSILQIVLVLILVEYAWWALSVLIPIKAETRKVIAVIVLVLAILMLLWAFGVIPLFHLQR